MKTASWRSHCRPVVTLALIVLATACTGGLKPTQFTNPDFDFGFVERVAVIPLENHSEDRQAGVRASRILITELLASGAVDVVEPGQVQSALDRIPSTGRAAPNTAELVELGETLGVQAIFVGSVEQSEILRSGTTQIPASTARPHPRDSFDGTQDH